ncbi:MAG TPA: hypothetical protein VJ783_26470 [Pirellulales bacterium]|nr:hypothetical protein [Pirellulales bacterium]
MPTALRTLAATVAGILVAFILVTAVELFSAVVHPFPEGVGRTPEETCLHVERYPRWILAVVVPAWAATAFAGTWTAMRMGNPVSFAIVSLLLLAAVVFNISMLPYPLWFKIANMLAIPAAIAAAGRLARCKKN